MNMNLNLDDEDEDEDDDGDGAGNGDGDGDDEGEVEKEETEVFADEANNDVSVAAATTTAAIFNTDNEVLDHEQDEDTLLMMQPGDILSRLLHKRPQKKKTGGGVGAAATVGLTSDGNEAGTATAAAMADTGVRFVAPARNGHRRTRANNQHKKHKSPKGLALSTLLCEGYNIEQRNCNSFECSGKCNEPFNANNG